MLVLEKNPTAEQELPIVAHVAGALADALHEKKLSTGEHTNSRNLGLAVLAVLLDDSLNENTANSGYSKELTKLITEIYAIAKKVDSTLQEGGQTFTPKRDGQIIIHTLSGHGFVVKQEGGETECYQ